MSTTRSRLRAPLLLTLAALCGVAEVGGAQEREASAGQSVADLAWLAGCWTMSAGGVTAEETWMAPRGGLMPGINRTTREGGATGYEFLLISAVDGVLVYEAHPSGQAAARFRATRVTAEAVTFENPQHDFPRRIEYGLRGADSLLAWIDDGGGGRRIGFPFRRSDCDGD